MLSSAPVLMSDFDVSVRPYSCYDSRVVKAEEDGGSDGRSLTENRPIDGVSITWIINSRFFGAISTCSGIAERACKASDVSGDSANWVVGNVLNLDDFLFHDGFHSRNHNRLRVEGRCSGREFNILFFFFCLDPARKGEEAN